jgi:hypothetical protein
MTPGEFYDITSQHIAGPNKDPQKAELMRTFVIPDRLVVSGSSINRPRTIKIFAAFISAEWVYVVSDFSGLVKMHLKSKKTCWTKEDLHPGSDVSFHYAPCTKFFIYHQDWNELFGAFKGGPDWVSEPSLAMSAIQRWRRNILEEHRLWRISIEELEQAFEEELKEWKRELREWEEKRKQRLFMVSHFSTWSYFNKVLLAQLTRVNQPLKHLPQAEDVVVATLPVPAAVQVMTLRLKEVVVVDQLRLELLVRDPPFKVEVGDEDGAEDMPLQSWRLERWYLIFNFLDS